MSNRPLHILLTGASSGIGEAYAHAFAQRGHKLTLVARRRPLLEKLAAELSARGAETFVIEQDLGKLEAIANVVAKAEAALGPVDVLINNAGVQLVGPTADLSVADHEQMLAVDLLAPLRLTRAVLPGMLLRKSGVIVDVASMAAIAPTPGMTYYNASKAGLAAASEALRGELRGTGVHVLTVYPGIIAETALAQASMKTYGIGRLATMLGGSLDVLARLTVRAVERRKSRLIYPYNGWLARWFPGITRFVVDRLTPPLARDPEAPKALGCALMNPPASAEP
jgi:short-subunit dehydrogenase